MIYNDLFPTSIWDSFTEMEEMMDDMSRLFDQTRRISPFGFGGMSPPVNLWAKEDGAMATVELPGVNPESISVSVAGNTLTIQGKQEIKHVHEGGGSCRWLMHQLPEQLEFTRTIQLPFPVESEQAEARYNKGILYVALRRPASEQPKKIAVKSA